MDATLKTFNYTFSSLSRNETYDVRIIAAGDYQWCSKDIVGKASEPVNIMTAAKGIHINCHVNISLLAMY